MKDRCIAQMVEQRIPNPQVAGSIPAAPDKVSIGRGFETSDSDYDGKICDGICVRVTSQAMCVALVAKSKNGDELIL